MSITRRGRRGDRGSIAVFGTVFIGVLALVAVFVAAVGGVLVDKRRVASAVDLAALAAASARQTGGDACAVARSVAHRNGASMVGCRVAGDVVTVRATVAARLVLGRTVRVTAEARAGPVTPR
jgi:secretion/DNA translocation related TadE-like protein